LKLANHSQSKFESSPQPAAPRAKRELNGIPHAGAARGSGTPQPLTTANVCGPLAARIPATLTPPTTNTQQHRNDGTT
jgi:hypothetical protein